MPECRVCGKHISEDIERQVGQTSVGAKVIDPTKGTKCFWDSKWYYFDSLVCRSKFEATADTYIT